MDLKGFFRLRRKSVSSSSPPPKPQVKPQPKPPQPLKTQDPIDPPLSQYRPWSQFWPSLQPSPPETSPPPSRSHVPSHPPLRRHRSSPTVRIPPPPPPVPPLPKPSPVLSSSRQPSSSTVQYPSPPPSPLTPSLRPLQPSLPLREPSPPPLLPTLPPSRRQSLRPPAVVRDPLPLPSPPPSPLRGRRPSPVYLHPPSPLRRRQSLSASLRDPSPPPPPLPSPLPSPPPLRRNRTPPPVPHDPSPPPLRRRRHPSLPSRRPSPPPLPLPSLPLLSRHRTPPLAVHPVNVHESSRLPQPAVFLPTCPVCKSRPVACQTDNGKCFDYCSKTCAKQARNLNQYQSGGQSGPVCQQCKQKPPLRKGDKVYPYCGLACSKLALNSSFTPVGRSAPGVVHPALRPTVPGSICKTPGCALPMFVRRNGTPSGFCSVTHEEWSKRGCMSCRAAPMSDVSVLCQSCHDDALNEAPMIIRVPEDHENFKSVESQFKRTWRHNTQCPDVKVVYKIIVAEESLKRYQQYLDDVEARGKFAAIGKSRGNEHRRWHGTKRKCFFGDPGHMSLCEDPGCSLCCIIKTSFDLKFFKAATGWGRFGHGIYTSSTSSKSNDYSRNVDINSEWKALLLNKVVVGHGKRLIQNDASLAAPPPGFDSVLAEVAPGGSLNYDELVVYHNDAVRPSYLVMYGNS